MKHCNVEMALYANPYYLVCIKCGKKKINPVYLPHPMFRSSKWKNSHKNGLKKLTEDKIKLRALSKKIDSERSSWFPELRISFEPRKPSINDSLDEYPEHERGRFRY